MIGKLRYHFTKGLTQNLYLRTNLKLEYTRLYKITQLFPTEI